MRNNILLIAIFFTLLSCSDENKTEKNLDVKQSDKIAFSQEQIELAGIETGKIRYKEISKRISSKGRIEALPQNRAKISVPMEGYVDDIFIASGQNIKKGTPLVSLWHPNCIEIQKQFLQVESQFEYLESEYKRQKTLYKKNADTGKVYEKIRSEYHSLRAEPGSFENKT